MHLDCIAVRQDLQGNGLGRYLMGRVITKFVDLVDTFGTQALTLRAKDARAQAFYRRLGFVNYGDPRKRCMLLGSLYAISLLEA